MKTLGRRRWGWLEALIMGKVGPVGDTNQRVIQLLFVPISEAEEDV